MANLSQREIEVLREFERGRKLKETVDTLGWQDIKGLMDQMVDATADHLTSIEYADPRIIQGYQRRARDFREFRDTLLSEIDKSIEASKEVPQRLMTDPAEYDQDLS